MDQRKTPVQGSSKSPGSSKKTMVMHQKGSALNGSSKNSLTFDTLAEVLLRTFDVTPFVWKKTIDWASQIMLFYQVDVRGVLPKISKCVRVHTEGSLDKNPKNGPRLIPSIFLGDQALPVSFVKTIVGKENITSVSDLMKLLENVALLERVEIAQGGDQGDDEHFESFPLAAVDNAREGAGNGIRGFGSDNHAEEEDEPVEDIGDRDNVEGVEEGEEPPRKVSKRKRAARPPRKSVLVRHRGSSSGVVKIIKVGEADEAVAGLADEAFSTLPGETDEGGQVAQTSRDYGPTGLPFIINHFYRDIELSSRTEEKRGKRSGICMTCNATIRDVEKNTSNFIRHAKKHKLEYQKYIDEHPARVSVAPSHHEESVET